MHGKFSGEGLLPACPVLHSKIGNCWINPTTPTGVIILSQYNFSLTTVQRMRMFEVWFKTRFPSVLMYIISKYTLEICVINKESQSLLNPADFLLKKITAMSSSAIMHKNQHKKTLLIQIYTFFWYNEPFLSRVEGVRKILLHWTQISSMKKIT